MFKNKGFTLIELLVVIAIIGILSGIVMVFVIGARRSAQEAKVLSNLNQIRSAAEVYNVSYGKYGDDYSLGSCSHANNSMFKDDPEMKELINLDNYPKGYEVRCHISEGGKNYRVVVSDDFDNNPEKVLCGDSKQYVGEVKRSDWGNWNNAQNGSFCLPE
ncbi:MAG: type II secretion system protein [Patescibacteria group bacterium]